MNSRYAAAKEKLRREFEKVFKEQFYHNSRGEWNRKDLQLTISFAKKNKSRCSAQGAMDTSA